MSIIKIQDFSEETSSWGIVKRGMRLYMLTQILAIGDARLTVTAELSRILSGLHSQGSQLANHKRVN